MIAPLSAVSCTSNSAASTMATVPVRLRAGCKIADRDLTAISSRRPSARLEWHFLGEPDDHDFRVVGHRHSPAKNLLVFRFGTLQMNVVNLALLLDRQIERIGRR